MSKHKEKVLISVIVPCYNDESIILLTHKQIIATLGNNENYDLEIIYIDDGSKDNTSGILSQLALNDNRITFVKLSRNFGQQAAITAGLLIAKGNAVATMDSDLQDPPIVLLEMIKKWSEGFDVVYGIRMNRKESFLKKFCYSAFYFVLRKMADIKIPPDSGDFSVIDRKIVDIMNALPERNRFVRGLRAWCGFKQYGYPYDRDARIAGESFYSMSKMIKLALDGFFNFSVRPLTLITLLGISAATFSFLLLILFFTQRVFGFQMFGYTSSSVPGFASVILSILFFSGVQLISIGILGEYIGRIYEEVKARPGYIMEEKHYSSYHLRQTHHI